MLDARLCDAAFSPDMTGLWPLDLKAIRFPIAPMPWRTASGLDTIRWVKYGMPYLGEHKWLKLVVFFLYPTAEDAKNGKKCGGTGFFYSPEYYDGSQPFGFMHGITNWHVACQGASVIRVPKIDGSFEIFDFGPEDWIYRPGWHDVAISPPLMLHRDVR